MTELVNSGNALYFNMFTLVWNLHCMLINNNNIQQQQKDIFTPKDINFHR